MDNVEITLKLSLNNINAILVLVSRGAYAEVADLITEIRRQVQPQFEAAQAASAKTVTLDPPAN